MSYYIIFFSDWDNSFVFRCPGWLHGHRESTFGARSDRGFVQYSK